MPSIKAIMNSFPEHDNPVFARAEEKYHFFLLKIKTSLVPNSLMSFFIFSGKSSFFTSDNFTFFFSISIIQTPYLRAEKNYLAFNIPFISYKISFVLSCFIDKLSILLDIFEKPSHISFWI